MAGVGVAVGTGVDVPVGSDVRVNVGAEVDVFVDFGVGLNTGNDVATGVSVREIAGTGVSVAVLDGDVRMGRVAALDVNVEDGDICSTVLVGEQEKSKNAQTMETRKLKLVCICRYVLPEWLA